MHDAIYESFLVHQLDEAARLTASSDIVTIRPLGLQHYRLRFRCNGLVLDESGTPRLHDDFSVAVHFPSDYARLEQHPAQVVQWVAPLTVWHPNIRPPFVCTGPIAPGESLTDLAYRLFEIISFHKVSPHHALNAEASQWVRHHQDMLPLDRRPLFRPRVVADAIVVEDMRDGQ
jgi:hypothetical protein